jgi:hypothetical protein
VRQSVALLALAAGCMNGPVLAAGVAVSAAEPSRTAELVARAIGYEHGEGVPRNLPLAVQLYCDAARAGDADAQFRLGWMYSNGRGVPRSDQFAAGLFALAAAQGDEYANRMLRFVDPADAALPACMRPPERGPLAASERPDPFTDLPPREQAHADLVRELAPTYEIDPALALAIVAVESRFRPHAQSPKGARGLMQLIPATAARFEVANALDAKDNVRGGLAYLRWLLAYYQGRLPLVLAAYNAGEGAVDRYRGIPPYRETREYVRRVLGIFRAFDHPYDPGAAEPSPSLLHSTRPSPGAAY